MQVYDRKELRADMYLPDRLLGFGIFLGFLSILFFAFIFIYDKWFFGLIGLGSLVLGFFAILCWKNQKINIISEDFFEYTTMFGKTTRYAFKDIRELKKNPDSMTLFVGEDKVHMESMAILSSELLEKIEIALGHKKAPRQFEKVNFKENLDEYIAFLSKGEYVFREPDGAGAYLPEIQKMIFDFYQSDVVYPTYMNIAPPLMERFDEVVPTLTEDEVRACITFVIRSEHFGEGLMLSFLENKMLLCLLQKYREILQE